jgi:hypothetical protein
MDKGKIPLHSLCSIIKKSVETYKIYIFKEEAPQRRLC